MAIYCVTGKLGGGKTLACVGRIRDALLEGRRVATNLDLYPQNMLPLHLPRVDIVRLPDKPTVADFEFIGNGNRTMDESRNGVVVLDELGMWFNSRTWNDKGRQAIIDWLLLSRKLGWDIYFIIQDLSMIDAQARKSLVEFLVVCRRLDRLRVPYIGGAAKLVLDKPLMLPKVHVATVRYGIEANALVADRWVYRARDLYVAYNTKQIFTDKRVDPYSLVWKPQSRLSLKDRLFWVPPPVQHKPKHPLVEKIMRLPDPRQREEFIRRFQQCGTL